MENSEREYGRSCTFSVQSPLQGTKTHVEMLGNGRHRHTFLEQLPHLVQVNRRRWSAQYHAVLAGIGQSRPHAGTDTLGFDLGEPSN